MRALTPTRYLALWSPRRADVQSKPAPMVPLILVTEAQQKRKSSESHGRPPTLAGSGWVRSSQRKHYPVRQVL